MDSVELEIGLTFAEAAAMRDFIARTRVVDVPDGVDIKALHSGYLVLRRVVGNYLNTTSNGPQ